MNKNTPYVKAYVKGKLINPITKDKPYVNPYPTTAENNRAFKNSVNNKKGVRLIVTHLRGGAKKVIDEKEGTTQWNVTMPSFVKSKIRPQLIYKPRIRKGKPRTFKTIYHYE